MSANDKMAQSAEGLNNPASAKGGFWNWVGPLDRPEDEVLPPVKTFLYGLQHVLTMAAGLLAVPLIIGQAAGLPTDRLGLLVTVSFFVAGLATVLQTVGVRYIGARLPIVQGVSFASVATMVAITTKGGGLPAVIGAVIVSAAIGFLIAPVFSKLIRFFPPVVTGSVITTIGFSLVPVAMMWALGGNPHAASYGSPENIGLAALTLVIAVLLSKAGSGMLSRLSFLLAIIIGTIIAIALGKSDFSSVHHAAIFAAPHLFDFGLPTFNIAAIISMFIAVLVILTETSADLLAISEIVGTKMGEKRLAKGLRADMLSSFISPFLGSFTQSAFAQNVGLVAVTRINSRFTAAAGGIILIILGLFPILGTTVASIPPMVLGGAGLILFATVGASGIRVLSAVTYEGNMNLIIVAVSIGIGMIPIINQNFYQHFPLWFQTIFDSGISASAIVAVSLNLLFNHLSFGTSKDPSVFSEAINRTIRPEVLEALEHGDRCLNGKIVDADGHEIPVAIPSVPLKPAGVHESD